MARPDPQVHVYGIRHHGPGSARRLCRALEALQPDAVLIEGPCEADDLIPMAADPGMQPPVALLAYVPDEPRRAVFYPFALFSPEWQALQYGIAHGAVVRFMDLPQRNWLAMHEPASVFPDRPPEMPFETLARAAGMEDGEQWWTQTIEERPGEEMFFEHIQQLMAVMREDTASFSPLEPLREAAMRRTIRQAQKEGRQRIAVVCGAWHAPALTHMPSAGADNRLLQGLPHVQVAITWVPWTYAHLAFASGYGAGITSPGWYEHLWTTPQETTVRWLSHVAQLLRDEDMDASAAQVIDAVRLTESLAALRGRPYPTLPELNEATRSVFCLGDALPLELVRSRLIVGDRLGQVPGDAVVVPLQHDLAAAQKRLRFPPQAEPRQVDLDLRTPNDLERSQLLHRLNLLGVPWGHMQHTRGQRGTFHELWVVQWQPALAVTVIEAAMWGNTVAQAANARARRLAEEAQSLAAVTVLLEQVLLAGLDEAVGDVVRCLQAKTALSGDVIGLMGALPPLIRTQRYGDVRRDAGTTAIDAAQITRVIDELTARIVVGLPPACASLDDDAAQQMIESIESVHTSLDLSQRENLIEEWQHALAQLVDQQGIHPLLAGRCCRMLYDRGRLNSEQVARRLQLALSPANEPARGAAWLHGLLRGSGLLLLQDEALWSILDTWVTALPGERFHAGLPMLRRTFSAFPAPERRQMGERVRHGTGVPGRIAQQTDRDQGRADAVLPLLAMLLRGQEGARK